MGTIWVAHNFEQQRLASERGLRESKLVGHDPVTEKQPFHFGI